LKAFWFVSEEQCCYGDGIFSLRGGRILLEIKLRFFLHVLNLEVATCDSGKQ